MALVGAAGWPQVARAAAGPAANAAPDASAADGGLANFDRSMLAGAGRDTADLSRFEHGNTVLPGVYNLDVYLNKNWVARMDVRFAAPSKDANAVPCVSTELLSRMGLAPAKADAAGAGKLASPACVGLGDLIPGATLSFDMSDLRMDASVPQAYMQQRPRGWVDPASWDAGVPAFLLNYNFNSYHTTSGGQSQTSTYLGLRSGFNIGLWQFRQDSTVTLQSGTNQPAQRHWHDIDAYVQRALPGLRAELSVGDSYTDGAVFDSYGLRGVQLATDDRMLPQSLRGYAPVVHGVAYTNAKVTVTQNGVQIYQTTVAPGPFVIDDLYPTGYGGDLIVNVTEADGRQHSFTVPYASVAQLLRPGITRFDVAVGQLRNSIQTLHDKPGVIQGVVQHGFSNHLTGYAGVQGSEGYAAALVGGAFNTRFGALALDVTQAHAVIPDHGTYNGQSFRITYSKVIPETNTSLSVAADRYSTSGFLSLIDAETARDYTSHGLDALQYQPTNQQTIDGLPGQSLLTPAQLAALSGSVYNGNGLYTATGLLQQRNRFTLTLNQQLGSNGGTLYANASINNYWNRNGDDTQFQVGYNSHVGRLSYGISVSRARMALGGYDNQVSFTASLPLGDTPHSPSLSFNLNHDTNSGTQEQATLNGTLGQWNQFNYGATASHGGDGTGNAYSLSGGYNSPYATFNASVGSGSGYSQASIGASGAVVAHAGGVTFGQSTGDTVALVHAPGAAGAHILSAPGLTVDRSGYALVPYLMPYQLDTVQIDPQGLPLGVQLDATSANVAPYAGAVVMVNFESKAGRALIARIRLADGKTAPFGAQVFDAKDQPLGVVGQGGMALLRGVGPDGRLSVQWNDEQGVAHACAFSYTLPKSDKSVPAYEQIQATCTAAGSAPTSQKENGT